MYHETPYAVMCQMIKTCLFNRQVPHEVTGLLASSSEDFVGNLIVYTTDMNLDTGSGKRTTRKITTLSKFKASLDTLMKTLSSCDLHYVRCLKPNPSSLSGNIICFALGIHLNLLFIIVCLLAYLFCKQFAKSRPYSLSLYLSLLWQIIHTLFLLLSLSSGR